jgi:hypothetical protein
LIECGVRIFSTRPKACQILKKQNNLNIE